MIPVIWMVLWIPILFRQSLTIFDDLDERLFHHPTITSFASGLPFPDLSDYQSATTPLYHLLMSPVSWITDDNLLMLRAVNLCLSGLALWFAIRALASWGRPMAAAIGGLCIGMSPYFVGPGVRLSTDNAALLFVFALLYCTHPRSKSGPWVAVIWATAAVWTRQIHLWVLAPMVLAGLTRRHNHMSWIVVSILPLAALTPLLGAWGGLTPPGFATGHQGGINIDVMVMALGVLGMYSIAFAPWLIRGLRRPQAKLWVPGIAALGLALLAQHPMAWADDPNRWGGALWSASRTVPALLDVPVTFWITVPLGALTLLAFATHPDQEHGRFLSLVAVAFIGANMLSARAYQKYYDPMCLFMLAAYIQGLGDFSRPWIDRAAWIGPCALAVALGAVSMIRFFG
jgi:hypothetical protein